MDYGLNPFSAEVEPRILKDLYKIKCTKMARKPTKIQTIESTLIT